ncbi:UNVERIFIED_CONTAM: hypothetical protein HHA_315460 [Hammondia hammondi]|eukprot:XP_008883405.1 hypothetical protein HHA_315460 [Hammondia hammondi]
MKPCAGVGLHASPQPIPARFGCMPRISLPHLSSSSRFLPSTFSLSSQTSSHSSPSFLSSLPSSLRSAGFSSLSFEFASAGLPRACCSKPQNVLNVPPFAFSSPSSLPLFSGSSLFPVASTAHLSFCTAAGTPPRRRLESARQEKSLATDASEASTEGSSEKPGSNSSEDENVNTETRRQSGDAAEGEMEDILAAAWQSVTQGTHLSAEQRKRCADAVAVRTDEISQLFAAVLPVPEGRSRDADETDKQTESGGRPHFCQGEKTQEDVRRAMQDLASFFFLCSALKLTSLGLRESLFIAASRAASVARLSSPAISSSSNSSTSSRGRRKTVSATESQEGEGTRCDAASPPSSPSSPSVSSPTSSVSPASSLRQEALPPSWAVQAEDAALLLRCLGSEGRGGTHTDFSASSSPPSTRSSSVCSSSPSCESSSSPSSQGASSLLSSTSSSPVLEPTCLLGLPVDRTEAMESRPEVNEKEITEALVEALLRWTRASMVTAAGLTNALQGYAWNAARRGCCPVDPRKVGVFLRPLERGGAHLFSPQQLAEILEALLLLNCRTFPRIREVVEIITAELLRTNQSSASVPPLRSNAAGFGTGDAALLSSCSLSPQQLTLWLVVLTKYRVENDEAFEIVAEILQQPDVVRRHLSPSLMAGLAYSFGNFLGGRQQVSLETLATGARQKLHLFSLGDLSQLLVSLTKAGIVDRVLFARSAVLVRRSLALQPSSRSLSSSLSSSDSVGSSASSPFLFGCADASPEQVVNLCVTFARQKQGDERLFESLAGLLLAPPPSWLVSIFLKETPRDTLPETRLECLTAEDLISVVVAFAQIRKIQRPLFEAVDSLLVSRMQDQGSLSPSLTLRILQAHAKLGYRSIELHHCLLLSLAMRISVLPTRLSVAELLQLVEATESLGLALPPRLSDFVNKELPPELRKKSTAADEDSDEEEVANMWRGMRVNSSGKKKKRQKARRRKWTW